jgi:hypothetical protein
MPIPTDDTAIAELLAGTWRVRASNFPLWLGGKRFEPRFGYRVRAERPLRLDDEVSYLDRAGKKKYVRGVDHWTGEEFVWRGVGLLSLFTSRWTIAGLSDDGSILVIRFSRSLATPAGVDVLERDGEQNPDLRSAVAGHIHSLGLSDADHASLHWLD